MAKGVQPPENDSARVLIASSRRELASAIGAELSREQPRLVVAEPVVEPERLLAAIQQSRPRMLLLDEAMLKSVTPQIRDIQMACPGIRVLLLSHRMNADLVRKVIQNGFHGILLKRSAPEACTKAVIRVLGGALWLPRAMLEETVLEYLHNPPASVAQASVEARLTRRQAQTVDQLCRGLTNKRIAGELGISEDTVKKHLQKAFRKLDVRNRAELIAKLGTANNIIR